jgi:2-deoxy-D-gluconate 3-dehydrogenase
VLDARRTEADDVNPFDLSGKVALVTGGNGGIGRGIALGLAAAGADVVVAARNPDKTAKVVAEIIALGRRAMGVQCDVQNNDDIVKTLAATRETFSGLDILVNNAGVAGGGFPQMITEEEWDRVVDTNLKSVFIFCKLAHPLLQARGGGKIINIGSEYGMFGTPFVLPYACAKGGITQMTKSLAISWAMDKIQINQIVPGWIKTDMTSGAYQNPAFRDQVVARTPQQRFGEPEDCAGTAVFLASAASNFITGQAIIIDGGYCIT